MNETARKDRRRAEARVGTVLKDKWRLDGLLGAGGMAVVYAATHRNGNRVAIKMLTSEDPEIRDRFRREGLVANAVEHPGTVRVHDDDVTDDGAAFLVMELLEGDPLDVLLKRRGNCLPVVEVLRLADQLLDVLAAAHARTVVHRDIKPQNLFLTHAGTLKVLDFGIARLRQGLDHGPATQTGVVLGTLAYMAPEQASAHRDRIDGRTDLWAVGATMFRMLTGRVVHIADSDLARLAAVITQPAPSVASVMPELPAPVVTVVDRALAYDPADRWPDATAMQLAVRAALAWVERGPDAGARVWAGTAPAPCSDRSLRRSQEPLPHVPTPGTGRTVASVALSQAVAPAASSPRAILVLLSTLTAAAVLGAAGLIVTTRHASSRPELARRGLRAALPSVLIIEQATPNHTPLPTPTASAASSPPKPAARPFRLKPLDRYP